MKQILLPVLLAIPHILVAEAQEPPALAAAKREHLAVFDRYKKAYVSREKAICAAYDKELGLLETRLRAGRDSEGTTAVQLERKRIKNGFWWGDFDKKVPSRIDRLRDRYEHDIKKLQRDWYRQIERPLQEYRRQLTIVKNKLEEDGDTRGAQLVEAAFIEASYNANAGSRAEFRGDWVLKEEHLLRRQFNYKTRKWNGRMTFSESNRIEDYPHKSPKIWGVTSRGHLFLRYGSGKMEDPDWWGITEDGEFYFGHIQDDPIRVFTRLEIDDGLYWNFYECEHNKPADYVLGILKEIRPEEDRRE
jgi:hypothetical protein